MSKKSNLAKEINLLESEIRFLEGKRSRSMASILNAVISHTEPNETEVQFFRTFSAEIDIKREQLQNLTQQLERML